MNKIYALEYSGKNCFDGISHYVIMIAADSSTTAKQFVKDQIGVDAEATWIMSASYPRIYNSKGTDLAKVQAKILYNGSAHVDKKDLEIS